MSPPLQVLWAGPVGAMPAPAIDGPFAWQACASLDEAAQALCERTHDAMVLSLGAATSVQSLLHWPSLSQAVLDSAVVVLVDEATPEQAAALVGRGVQDVLPTAAADAATLARVLRLSVERKRIDRAARKAHATDLATGLPNHAQLLEHMTHLLALREREPAPMALLVLRVEGLVNTGATLGAESANVLRRKVAVRLRAGLRASDVVAALDADAFAVLLAWIDAPADALQVADKLARALRQPFAVAGQSCSVAVSLGLSQYPEHGRQADELLRRALGQASAAVALGGDAFAKRVQRGGARAANDEDADTP